MIGNDMDFLCCLKLSVNVGQRRIELRSAFLSLLLSPPLFLHFPGAAWARPDGTGETEGQLVIFSVPTVASPGSDFQFVDFVIRIC